MLGGGDGEQSGGESKLGMAKEMDSILHCRFAHRGPPRRGLLCLLAPKAGVRHSTSKAGSARP